MAIELNTISIPRGDVSKGKECNAHCTILGGSGNYGRALASQFHEAGINFTIGSRQSNTDGNLSYKEAIDSADVIFFAIPPHAYDDVSKSFSAEFSNKIIVDVSNLEHRDDPCNAIRLQTLLPNSHVVKALNTVSAYTLENDSYGASRDTYVCGDNYLGKSKVMQILRENWTQPNRQRWSAFSSYD